MSTFCHSQSGAKALERYANPPPPTSPALQQFLVLCLEHVELLGEADDDHEEQQHHQSRGAHGQTHHLELGHHRLAASALVPDVILDVASAEKKKKVTARQVLWGFTFIRTFASTPEQQPDL